VTGPRVWGWRLFAAAILLLGLLPVADWIPGGHRTSAYDSIFAGWWSGTLVALGLGWILGLLWDKGVLHGAGERILRGWDRAAEHPRLPLIVALAAALLYLGSALWVFGGRPLNIDEIVQLWQARMYAGGAVRLPTLGPVELFGSPHVIDAAGWRYGQFPAGGPAMLMLGTLLGAEWIVIPLFGALGVLAFAHLLPRIEPGPRTRLLALLLFACSPFALIMSGSYMNHVTTGAWLLVALWGMAVGVERGGGVPLFASGVAFGLAATIRPVDAFAFGAPAALWLCWKGARRELPWSAFVGWVVAGIIPVLGLAWVNWRTTGDPTLFGYQVLWGEAHNLGFHVAPWGEAHTPTRGLELVSLALFRLNTYFLETPFPSLLPALATLALARRNSAWDRYLLASGAATVLFYFTYWFDGFYLGPRFMYPLLPFLALATARCGGAIKERFGTGAFTRTAWGTLAAGAIVAVAYTIPLRLLETRRDFAPVRWTADEVAAEAKATAGVVLVRESWGAQLVARLWGIGATRPETEALYHWNDACVLEERLGQVEGAGLHGPRVVAALLAASDSAGLLKSPVSPDRSESYRPGTPYGPRCRERIEEDRRGFTVYPPVLLATGGLIWGRDLHERSLPLLERYPDLPFWLLIPSDTMPDSRPRLIPLSRDSLRATWLGAGAP
jgi:hypothetical protein